MLHLDPQHENAIAQAMPAALAQVAQCFADELTSDLPCVNELTTHLEHYRGKMLRPMLLLTSSATSQSEQVSFSDASIVLATVVEMVHMATLVHDDVLDDQTMRRSAQTINVLQGNEAAVMLGDYLISHAYHLCSSLNDQRYARLVARTTNTVCEGELLQLSHRDDWQLNESIYFEIIRRKTAVLCGLSTKLGAWAAGLSDQQADQLEQYAERLGMAFQIIDDVLDLIGDAEVVGKSLGKDIEKGKLTLPLIHHLSELPDTDRTIFINQLKTASADQLTSIVTQLQTSQSIDYARDRASTLIYEAKDCLADLPDTPARTMLDAMATAVLDRNH